MKRYFVTIMASLLVAVSFGKAYKINGVMYDLVGSEATVVAKNTAPAKLVIPQTVKYKGASYTVVAIDDNAFKASKQLKSVSIPATVTSIGRNAFLDCKLLSSLTLPEGVSVIGEKAFGHTALTSVILPASLTKIEDDAFIECPKLASVTLKNSTMRVSAYAFNGTKINELIFAEGCTTAFRTHILAKNIKLADSVTSINDCAFWENSILTSISIPETLNIIGDNAFYGCHNLVDINIPATLTTIKNEAFFDCSSLAKINIPASVTSLGERVFSGCKSLEEIAVDGENSNYASFEGVLFTKDKTTLIAFPNKKSATYEIPASVKSIAPEAFCECSGLESVTIPASVKNIGKRAFTGCTALATIYNYASSPQTVTQYTFSNNSVLHVLKGKKRSYGGAEGWQGFEIIDDLKKK